MGKFDAFLLFLSFPFLTAAEELDLNRIWFNNFAQVLYDQPYNISLIEAYIKSDHILTAALDPANRIQFESNHLLSNDFKNVDDMFKEKNIRCDRPATFHLVHIILEKSDNNSSVVVYVCSYETMQFFSVILIKSTHDNVTVRPKTDFSSFFLKADLQVSGRNLFHSQNFCISFAFFEKMYKDVNYRERNVLVLKITFLVIAASITVSFILVKLFRWYEEPMPFIQ